MSLRNPTTPALTLSLWSSMKSMATSSPIKQAASPLHQTVATHMLWYSTSLMPMQFDLFPSRIGQKKKFFVHTARSTSGSHTAVSNLSYKNSTTKHKDVKAFVAMEQTHIQYTPPDIHCMNPAERAIPTWKNHFLPAWLDYQNHSPLPTGVTSQRNAMPHSTCYVHVIKILSSWHTKHSRDLSCSMQHPWLP
jgi:hypothetical protein